MVVRERKPTPSRVGTPFDTLDNMTETIARERLAALRNVQALQIEDAFGCTALQAGLLPLTARHSEDHVRRIVLGLHPDVDTRPFRDA